MDRIEPLDLANEKPRIGILLNGRAVQVTRGVSVGAFIRMLCENPRGVAVERNLEIVPRGEHSSTLLQEGDRLEFVQFVGGG